MQPLVVSLGELLIDFVPTVTGVTLLEAPAFQKAAGGAPANVAVGLARLGVASAFLGKVGDDPFGHFLAQTLREVGVDVSGLRFAAEARTMLAFVSLRTDGEREFVFYRHPSADMLYRPDEVATELIRGARFLHAGSITLISEPARSATLHAIQVAREAGVTVSYDPNLRLNLWPDATTARAGLLEGWRLAHVIKASEEEIAFLTGTAGLAEGVRRLWHPDLRLVCVTRGSAGCVYFTPDVQGTVPGFAVTAVDTTGAGDAFVAGLLKGLCEHTEPLDAGALERICRYANAVGALTTTRRGAIPALPEPWEVEQLLV